MQPAKGHICDRSLQSEGRSCHSFPCLHCHMHVHSGWHTWPVNVSSPRVQDDCITPRENTCTQLTSPNQTRASVSVRFLSLDPIGPPQLVPCKVVSGVILDCTGRGLVGGIKLPWGLCFVSFLLAVKIPAGRCFLPLLSYQIWSDMVVVLPKYLGTLNSAG